MAEFAIQRTLEYFSTLLPFSALGHANRLSHAPPHPLVVASQTRGAKLNDLARKLKP